MEFEGQLQNTQYDHSLYPAPAQPMSPMSPAGYKQPPPYDANYGVPHPQIMQPTPPVMQPTPPIMQQSDNTNVVVVNQQPTTPQVVTVTRQPVGDHYLTLAIILTIICFICGTWCYLPCSIAAIIFASMARDAEARGDLNDMQTKSRVALGCNIATVVCWIALNIGVVIAIAVGVTTVAGSASAVLG